uniref:Uncharacterized protein n=1 Tax=Chlorocebus sabaeus TaxID=60711 RepID=A0A0D9SCH2_CHLSB
MEICSSESFCTFSARAWGCAASPPWRPPVPCTLACTLVISLGPHLIPDTQQRKLRCRWNGFS